MPNFMLALVLLYISVMVFGTSVGGLFSPQYVEAAWSWGRLWDLLSHLWVPALVLAIAGTAFQIRTMRATLLDEKNKLYVTAARARGMSEGRLLLMKYPVRVALNPIVSTIGWELTAIISGAPIVAFVLALPDTGPALPGRSARPGLVPGRRHAAHVLGPDHLGHFLVRYHAGHPRPAHSLRRRKTMTDAANAIDLAPPLKRARRQAALARTTKISTTPPASSSLSGGASRSTAWR